EIVGGAGRRRERRSKEEDHPAELDDAPLVDHGTMDALSAHERPIGRAGIFQDSTGVAPKDSRVQSEESGGWDPQGEASHPVAVLADSRPLAPPSYDHFVDVRQRVTRAAGLGSIALESNEDVRARGD